MNINLVQNNSNIEWITSDIISKMYQTTIDSNNTILYSGYLKSESGYGSQVQYLNNRFGPNLKIEIQRNYIDIEDPEVKRLLIKIAGDGIGVSTEDAATKNIGKLFRNNTIITSFNEFEQFIKSNTDSADNMFYQCTNLESINLANVSVVIGQGMFYECTNLQNVNGFQNIDTIKTNGFYGCSNLREDVANLYNVKVIGNSAFMNNRNLYGELNLRNIIQIGEYVFRDVLNVTKVKCLGKLSFVPTALFWTSANATSSLQEVYIPYECTSIYDGAFQECKNLTTIKQYKYSIDNWVEGEEPETEQSLSKITSFGVNCFKNCRSLSLTDSDVSGAISIGSGAFEGCTSAHFVNLDLSNVSTLATRAFSHTKVDNVVWSNSKTDLSTGIFEFCGLKSITNLDAVTKVWGRSLQGCQLNHVLYFKNVDRTDYGQSEVAGDSGCVFCGDDKNAVVPALYMPKTIDIFGGYYDNNTYSVCFFGNRGTATIPIVYFKELTDLYPGSFGSLICTSLIINNTVPPIWYNTKKWTDEQVANNQARQKNIVFPNDGYCQITNIYVPDSALSTYLADPNWASLTDSSRRYPVTFLGMSNLTHYATEADWVTAGKPADGIIDTYMN